MQITFILPPVSVLPSGRFENVVSNHEKSYGKVNLLTSVYFSMLQVNDEFTFANCVQFDTCSDSPI